MGRPIYLGDAVYAEFRHGQLVLWTSDGVRNTNTIYLEDGVLVNLFRYLGQERPDLCPTKP